MLWWWLGFTCQELQCLLTGFETSVIAMLTIFRSLPLSQGKKIIYKIINSYYIKQETYLVVFNEALLNPLSLSFKHSFWKKGKTNNYYWKQPSGFCVYMFHVSRIHTQWLWARSSSVFNSSVVFASSEVACPHKLEFLQYCLICLFMLLLFPGSEKSIQEIF